MSSDLSFDDLVGLPLNPSPVRETAHGLSTQDRPEPSRSNSPSPHPGTVVLQRKRPAEDMSQFAGDVSRAHKLVKADNDTLCQFAKSGRSEQLILLAGQLLSISRCLNQIQPAETSWVVPKKLQAKIDDNALILLMDPSLPAYRDDKIGPGKLLMNVLKQNPSWGFSLHLHDEQDVVDAINSSISKSLTARRNTIKSAISGSLGTDPINGTALRTGSLNVVELTSLIITRLKARSITTNVMLCGRVSLLRKIFTEHGDNTYWAIVDKRLCTLRTGYPDALELSRFIKQRMLQPDLNAYGSVDLQSLDAGPSTVAAAPSTVLGDSGSGHNSNDEDE